MAKRPGPDAGTPKKPWTALALMRLVVLSLAAALFLVHLGLYFWESRRWEKAVAPKLAFAPLEAELWQFRALTNRWPASLEEFATLRRSWAWDATRQASRIRQCAGAPCTGVRGTGYLYLYQQVAPAVGAVWAFPQVTAPLPAAHPTNTVAATSDEAASTEAYQKPHVAVLLDPATSPVARFLHWWGLAQPLPERVAAYQAQAVAVFAVCVAPAMPQAARCRQWRGHLPADFTPAQAQQNFTPTPAQLQHWQLVEFTPTPTPSRRAPGVSGL